MKIKVNLTWIKRNLVLFIFLPVIVALTVLTVMAQRKAATRETQIDGEVQAKQAELNTILGTKPYPSRENIEVVRRDSEQLSQSYQTMLQAASRGTIVVPEFGRPVEFAEVMVKTIQRLRATAVGQGVVLPPLDQFYFGFGQYRSALPGQGIPRDKVDEMRQLLTTLSKQLLVIERLGQLLMTNHVQRIEVIRRVEVEPSQGGPDAMMDAQIVSDPNALYNTMPFELEFAGDADSVRGFLNSLSQSEWFFAVRLVKVDVEVIPASTGTVDPVTGRLDTSTATPGGSRLKALMRIDLVEFPAAKPIPSA